MSHTPGSASLHSADKETQDMSASNTNAEPSEYPPLRTVVLIMTALYLAMFLVALDRIIISTAVPRITDTFHSLDDIGWYGSSYVLATCATQLLFGRLYSFFNNKAVFLSSILLFEVGSALCGAAPNSTAFILGRAIAGAGAAGVWSGAIVITIPLVPLAKRPKYQGFLGAVFGISSVIGPLIGGAFTNNPTLTWRWCFYINLPIGAVSVAIISLCLRVAAPPQAHLSPREKFVRMDPIGTLIFTPSIVCLLLALQWGGSTYAWSDPRTIVLLVVFGVSLLAWGVLQVRSGDNATLPPRILFQRSIVAGLLFSMCIGGIMLTVAYYLAIWFQAVTGVDALQSGIRSLPFVLPLVVASIMAGAGVTRVGYYAPFVIASGVLMAIGAGLLTLLRVDSSSAQWIGFQILVGFGMGLGMQQSGIAAQATLKREDVPTGVSLMFFGQSLGGAVFLCVAQNVFVQRLVAELGAVLSASSASLLANVGATDLRTAVSPEELPGVLVAYNSAIVTTLYVTVGVACFSVLPALTFEWRNIKGMTRGGGRKVDEEAKDVEKGTVKE